MTDSSKGMTRRGLLRAFAATAIVATPTYANAFGFLKGAGDIRRIRMYSQRSGERLDTIYWIEGDYIPEALAEINHFMRDWRNGEAVQIDTRTIDIIAAPVSHVVYASHLNQCSVFGISSGSSLYLAIS